MHTIWRQKAATYSDTIVAGKHLIQGRVYYCGDQYRFRLREQPDGRPYRYRGWLIKSSPLGDRSDTDPGLRQVLNLHTGDPKVVRAEIERAITYKEMS